jgi:hypothetical protein
MKIESLIRIIGGVLQNSPSVSFVEDFQIDSSKVTRGCAFFDVHSSFEDVRQALQNGAYTIISSQKYEILDTEIAWIQTHNLSLALTKLCRFFIQEKNITVLIFPRLYFELLRFIRFQSKAKTLQQDIQSAFIQILKAKEQTLFLALQSDFSVKIIPEVENFDIKDQNVKIFSKSLFYSSFIHNDKFIFELRMNAFFIPYFSTLLMYLEKQDLQYEIINYTEFEHFYPIFVDINLVKKDFGAGSKVLIFEKDEELFYQELQYLKDQKLQKSFLTCSFKKEYEDKDFEHISLQSPQDILNLCKRNFRYVLILADKEDFLSFFEEKKLRQLTLI